ncbi:phage baseplate assembly protein [Variovorax sp. E3]|uniref:phage baseplate assembly protein domain-containing protein n=1 Tax=Variovorax sp. E3 TaxID=1914993 RepID=UPI0018DE0AE0|nr:phage baseplate assembly protein [Variovorax sp. E3]
MSENMIRRARLRNLKEGKVQTLRAEALDDDAKDAVERFQDYGFAANPVDGQGLVINAGGHTIAVRMDRLAERPRLASYEVRVWHKEGHSIALKDGRLIEVECDDFVLKAANSVKIQTKTMTVEASEKTRVEAPLTENTGRLKTQDFTIGLSGPGTATMDGGTITYQNVSLNYKSCATTFELGTIMHDGRDISGKHKHPVTGAITDIPNPP